MTVHYTLSIFSFLLLTVGITPEHINLFLSQYLTREPQLVLNPWSPQLQPPWCMDSSMFILTCCTRWIRFKGWTLEEGVEEPLHTRVQMSSDAWPLQIGNCSMQVVILLRWEHGDVLRRWYWSEHQEINSPLWTFERPFKLLSLIKQQFSTCGSLHLWETSVSKNIYSS